MSNLCELIYHCIVLPLLKLLVNEITSLSSVVHLFSLGIMTASHLYHFYLETDPYVLLTSSPLCEQHGAHFKLMGIWVGFRYGLLLIKFYRRCTLEVFFWTCVSFLLQVLSPTRALTVS